MSLPPYGRDNVLDLIWQIAQFGWLVVSAKHLESWNVDRALYEKAHEEFLVGL